jgi:hypothetical protein
LDLGWGRHSIPGAESYVSPSGEVLLWIKAGSGGMVDVESLTITIKGQR